MSAIREALEAAQDAMSDAENFWGLDFDAALRKIDAALALEADTLIQSVAQSPRDGKQPAGEAYSSRRTPLAAPFPKSGHEHVCCSPTDRLCVPTEMVTLSAGESVTPFPHPHDETSPSAATGVDGSGPSVLSFDPAFLAAWRESQGQPVDAEAR